MKSINLIILFLMAVLPTYARGNQLQQQNNQDKKKKEHKVAIYGDVKDSFTQAYLKAFVTVMDKDSNVIDTMTTSGWGKPYDHPETCCPCHQRRHQRER